MSLTVKYFLTTVGPGNFHTHWEKPLLVVLFFFSVSFFAEQRTYGNFKNAKTQQAVWNWEEEISNSSCSDHKCLSIRLAFRYKMDKGLYIVTVLSSPVYNWFFSQLSPKGIVFNDTFWTKTATLSHGGMSCHASGLWLKPLHLSSGWWGHIFLRPQFLPNSVLFKLTYYRHIFKFIWIMVKWFHQPIGLLTVCGIEKLNLAG